MPLPNLAKRVLFAVVAIPVVIAAVWFGGDALALLLAVASALAAWELTRLARAAGYTPFSGAAIASYQRRERRFGRTSEQLSEGEPGQQTG